jgi:hypothetical protein
VPARFHIVGTDLPGRADAVHVGVQRGRDVVDLVAGDAALAEFTFDVDVRNARFGGPYVHGKGGERFVYLSWGEVVGGTFTMFRRAKLQLDSLDPTACDGHTVEGRLGLTDVKGGPLCASVRPPTITWTVT